MSVYVLWKLDGELDESKYEKANESAGSDASYYGLPEDTQGYGTGAAERVPSVGTQDRRCVHRQGLVWSGIYAHR